MDEINPKLREICDIERSSYEKLHKILSAVSERQARWRPTDHKWSIGELAHHLSLSQGRILRAMEIALRSAEERNLEPDANMESAAHSLDFGSEKTRQDLQTTPNLMPQYDRDLGLTLGEMETQQTRLAEMLPRLNRRDPHQLKFPHMILGELDLYQWILFWGGHASRHRRQIVAVMQHPGFEKLGTSQKASGGSTST